MIAAFVTRRDQLHGGTTLPVATPAPRLVVAAEVVVVAYLRRVEAEAAAVTQRQRRIRAGPIPAESTSQWLLTAHYRQIRRATP
jgi:hypothetical protein